MGTISIIVTITITITLTTLLPAHCGARPEPWHHPVVPALRPHKSLLLRAVILIRKKSNNRMHVLVSEKTAAHLPVCQINPMRSIHSTLKKYLTEIFGAEIPAHKLHGMLSLEHSGRPANSNDGCCLTLLISVKVGSRRMKIKPTLQCPPISHIPPIPSKILFQVPLE